MTTPLKQRANSRSANSTPFGSKSKETISANLTSNAENMTPSRLNRVYPPKPQATGEQNGGDGEGIQGMIFRFIVDHATAISLNTRCLHTF